MHDVCCLVCYRLIASAVNGRLAPPAYLVVRRSTIQWSVGFSFYRILRLRGATVRGRSVEGARVLVVHVFENERSAPRKRNSVFCIIGGPG